MAILDGLLGTSLDDPRTMATMQLAQGLLSGNKALPAISQGLLGYGSAMAEAKQRQAQEQYRKMQMDAMALQYQQAQKAAQQQELDQKLTQQAFTPIKPIEANQASGIGGPRPAALGAVGQQPAFDPRQFIASGGSAPLAFQLEQSVRKDNTPIKLGAGEALFDPRTLKQLANNPKAEDLPSAIKEYNFAVQQGERRSFTEWQAAMKRAGATNVSVPVSMDKGFGDTFAKQAAEGLGASRDQAKAAASTIGSLDRIDQIIAGGNVALGPGQKTEITLRQIGEKFGAGKDNAERLANTRELIQKASALAVDGAKMLAGQGQITEGERALVGRAAGGDIDTLTAPEITALTGALRKINQSKIQQHQQLLSKVSPQFGAFAPFYQVDSPTPAAVPAAAQRSIKRTGTMNGKRVVEYSDGTVEYAPN